MRRRSHQRPCRDECRGGKDMFYTVKNARRGNAGEMKQHRCDIVSARRQLRALPRRRVKARKARVMRCCYVCACYVICEYRECVRAANHPSTDIVCFMIMRIYCHAWRTPCRSSHRRRVRVIFDMRSTPAFVLRYRGNIRSGLPAPTVPTPAPAQHSYAYAFV